MPPALGFRGRACFGATPMIPVPSNVNIWLATGATDMRKGMNSLALHLQDQQILRSRSARRRSVRFPRRRWPCPRGVEAG
jgi:hypothetical protein